MADDVLLNKAETIEKCLKRIHEIYGANANNLHQDQLRQDAILLNVERNALSSSHRRSDI